MYRSHSRVSTIRMKICVDNRCGNWGWAYKTEESELREGLKTIVLQLPASLIDRSKFKKKCHWFEASGTVGAKFSEADSLSWQK